MIVARARKIERLVESRARKASTSMTRAASAPTARPKSEISPLGGASSCDLIGLLLVAQTNLAFESPEYVASFPLFRAAAQPFFDPGDPIHFVAGLSPDVAVLQQTGLGDAIIPLDSSVDLAAALGLQELGASRGTAPLRAFVRADPAKYPPAADVPAYNGHDVVWDFAPVRDQALLLLESDGRVLLAP
jgi:hypothetical protein